METNRLLKSILMVAKDAGYAINFDRNFDVKEKGDVANIVTSNDVKVQHFIIDRLKEILPEASVYAEEDDVREMNNGYVWVVDPIDGTTNYAYDLKHSCISIALLNNKEGLIGVVYNPYLDEAYYAVKGYGAFLNGKKISVTNHNANSSLCVVGTSPYAKNLADKTFTNLKNLFINTRDLRRSGSAALDLCNLAAGRYDFFYESNLAPWDYGAASTIIKEAGGIIDAISPDVWGFEKSIGVIAGNSNNFEDLKKLLK